ncbi:MAG: ATP-binding protein [Actinobacteria bacterium]|nr:ATP-binding protein [Actinomycetota bacterium]MCG2798067.1 ATP-binding protein [Cellulomonas sp.]
MSDVGHSPMRGDRAEDRQALLRGTSIVVIGFAVGASVQSAYVLSELVPDLGGVPVGARIAANAVGVVTLLVLLAAQPVHLVRNGWQAVPPVLLASVGAALVRLGAQEAFGVLHQTAASIVVEGVGGTVFCAFSAGVGVWAMLFSRAMGERARTAEREVLLVEVALAALEDEEIRVRRAVAEGLHSTMQQRLVMLVARLDGLAVRVEAGGGSSNDVAALREIRGEIEHLRAQDVREMSRLLYPDQLEVGVVPALRALLRRVPTTIATRLVVDDDVRVLDDPAAPMLTQAERLLAVRVVEEALTNALKHARPSSITVELRRAEGALTLEVVDDGGGFDPALVSPSGTARLRDRIALVGGRLEVVGSPGEGTRVGAWLPIDALRRR